MIRHFGQHRRFVRFCMKKPDPTMALRIAGCLLVFLFVSSVRERSAAAGDEPQQSTTQAHDQAFWAFRRLHRPEVPRVGEHAIQGLDAFVLSRLAQEGLSFAPEADRRTLCRRLHLDLIGLPPSPSAVAQFLDDQTPHAVEHLVDRLISSPQYGERWGRQWLDVVGYADSNGYIRHDSPRPLAYRYRDYVIHSLNDDKPYDQFWREQLAGDELAGNREVDQLSPQQIQQLIATHYLRNAPDGTDNTEGNETTRVIERYAVLEAILQTTMSAMFGMTIECARCHDHKFDPIPQTDYYSLQAIFYPAFNVKEWVQPKDRWIYAAGQTEIAAWKASQEQAEQAVAALQTKHQGWLAANRPPGVLRWSDDFSAESVAVNWSATAPGDSLPEAAVRTALDGSVAPAARLEDGRLSLLAAGAGDSRWLSTKQVFDWTPAEIGQWMQVTFDLTDSRGAGGQPAERVGFYIALHDYDDNSPVPGGNILFDGNPAGGAGVVLDYPGSDQKGLGVIGTTSYLPGRNFGVRITRTEEDVYLLEQLVGGQPETRTITLTAAQLPDGGFGYELCCARNFTVDNVAMESSAEPARDQQVEQALAEYTRQLDARNQELSAAVAAVNSQRLPEPEKIAWATDLGQTPPDVHLLERGDYFRPGAAIVPGMLSALSDADQKGALQTLTEKSSTTGRRLAFAHWATQPDSPAAALLARVQADRIWRGHFGQGLVPTPENFGASGVQPTHPELLEWLAAELVDHGWRLKHIHRLIVLSQTYRQSGEASPQSLERDPQNLAYSRFPVHRLEAEQVRDSMLAVAGVLNPKAGGPAVEFVDRGDRQVILPEPTGPGPHAVDRRSIYIRYRRSQPLTFLRAFDQASPDPNCVARGSSTVVAQSLAMLNGEFAQRMGREFARRVLAESPADSEEERIRSAFQIALAREPSTAELTRCRDYLTSKTTADNSVETWQAALSDLCRLLLATNEFLYLP